MLSIKQLKPVFKVKILLRIFFLLILFLILIYGLKIYKDYKKLVQITSQDNIQIFYDRKGTVLFSQPINGKNYQQNISIKEVSPNFIKTLILVEDKNFYNHNGVDNKAVIRSIFENAKGNKQGASTITQQYIKNKLNHQKRNFNNKTEEIILARILESNYSKDEILEKYINNVEFGNLATGIHAASYIYFGKEPVNLSFAESAFLVSIIQSPVIYNPYTNFNATKTRQESILHLLKENSVISENEYEIAKVENIDLKSNSIPISAPHFIDWIKEKYKPSEKEIKTTLDLHLYNLFLSKVRGFQEEFKDQFNINNVGAVLIDNKSGEVLVMIGNYNYFNGQNSKINSSTTKRDTGSSIKPIIWGLGFEKGLQPYSLVGDYEQNFITDEGQSFYPRNSDLIEHGVVTLKFALANSLNIPSVKIMEHIKPQSFAAFLKSVNIPYDKVHLSSSLGTTHLSLLENTSLYTILPNSGEYIEPNGLLSTQQNKVSNVFGSNSEKITYQITDILSDSNIRQETFKTHLNYPVSFEYAVKTGTSTFSRDNWALGYCKDYTLGVWVGNLDATPLNNALSYETASVILGDLFVTMDQEGLCREQKLPKPQSVYQHVICIENNFIEENSENCKTENISYFPIFGINTIENAYTLIKRDFKNIAILRPKGKYTIIQNEVSEVEFKLLIKECDSTKVFENENLIDEISTSFYNWKTKKGRYIIKFQCGNEFDEQEIIVE